MISLPALRASWIQERADVEVVEGREVQPMDNGYLSEKHADRTDERTGELPDYDRSKLSVLRAKKGKTVTQLHYARQGIVTPEMEFVAIRENMKLQALSEKLETSPEEVRNSLNHQHAGESFGASIPAEITPEFVREEGGQRAGHHPGQREPPGARTHGDRSQFPGQDQCKHR